MEAARLVLKLRQKNSSVENKLLTVEPSMSCLYIHGLLPLPTPHSSEPFIFLVVALYVRSAGQSPGEQYLCLLPSNKAPAPNSSLSSQKRQRPQHLRLLL